MSNKIFHQEFKSCHHGREWAQNSKLIVPPSVILNTNPWHDNSIRFTKLNFTIFLEDIILWSHSANNVWRFSCATISNKFTNQFLRTKRILDILKMCTKEVFNFWINIYTLWRLVDLKHDTFYKIQHFLFWPAKYIQKFIHIYHLFLIMFCIYW